MPAVIVLAYIAVFAATGSTFDLLAMTGFGVLGYVLRKLDFPLAPIILAVVLGPMMELNLRRAMSLSDGNLGILTGSPLALVLWAMVALSLLLPLVTGRRRKRARNPEGDAGT